MCSTIRYFFLFIDLSVIASLYAQDSENSSSGIEFTANILSRYIWRGYDLSHSDPYLSYFRGLGRTIRGNYFEIGFSDEFTFSKKFTMNP